MNRYPDWPQRLAAFMATRTLTPFAWVHNDCCTFAADAVVQIIGTDPMLPLRGRYASRLGAARLIKDAGSLQVLVIRYLGAPVPHPLTALRGDVALFEMALPYGPEALGVVVGAHIAAPGPAGSVLLPLSAAKLVWRI